MAGGKRDSEENYTVAHSLSAKKRIRQNIKAKARNRARKDAVKAQLKSFSAALGKNDFTAAETELRKVTRQMDRVSTKGTMHRNTASRKRSRLAKRLNAARKAGALGGWLSGSGSTIACATLSNPENVANAMIESSGLDSAVAAVVGADNSGVQIVP